MGQKVHPYGLRVGVTKPWLSRWFARGNAYASQLHEDIQIRKLLAKRLKAAAVAHVEIERTASRTRILIHTARPGVIIGRRGADIDKLREELGKLTDRELFIDIKEVKNPATNAQLVAQNVAFQLERQIMFRRAMKRAMQMAMNSGAKGIRIRCAGRLGGADIARREGYREGSIPLHTLRADVEYGFAEGYTTYGVVGVKVWTYKGETIARGKLEATETKEPEKPKAAAAPKAEVPAPAQSAKAEEKKES